MALSRILEDADNGLSFAFRELLAELREDLQYADARIAALDARIQAHVRDNPTAQRLKTIPGIGPVTASALVACVGDATAFRNGRHLAAFLGLTPRQHSTGGNRERCWFESVLTAVGELYCHARNSKTGSSRCFENFAATIFIGDSQETHAK